MNARFALLISSMIFPFAALGCGTDTDCVIEDGFYRIRMPESGFADGAIVFAHGYRGSASGTMRNESLSDLAERLGVAMIGIKSADEDWTIPGAPGASFRDNRDEVAYVGRVVDDAAKRFGIDRNKMLLTGFSAGGMLVWNVACHGSQIFSGYAPLSGTFWRPEPETCTTPPATVIHYHGTTDKIVPLSGRPIQETHQGDVPTVLYMYKTYGGFDEPIRLERAIGLSCDAEANADGRLLELCTFEGGHTFKSSYIERAWNIVFPE